MLGGYVSHLVCLSVHITNISINIGNIRNSASLYIVNIVILRLTSIT